MSLINAIKALTKNSKSVAALSEVHTNLMGYRQMGLKFDDLLPEEGELVQEALRRLPPREMQERNFRFKRAFSLTGTHSSLDSSEWIKPEEDLPYLRPLIAQVETEQASKVAFDNMSSIPDSLKRRNCSS